MATVPLTGAPGFRFWKDLYPTGRQGGLSYYPYSSIAGGLSPSWTLAAANPAATPQAVSVSVAAGTAYLDGQLATLASGVSVTATPTSVVDGFNLRTVYLNPTRVLTPVALGSSAPTVRLNGDAVAVGDAYCQAVDYGDYFSATKFFRYDGVNWNLIDPSFEAPAVPAQSGKNRTWGGECYSKVTSSNFTVDQIEKRIYVENLYPPYVSSNSKALLRDVASLEVANVSLYYYVLPKPVTATFTNGSTTVTVAAASRSLVADIVASIAATTTIAIDGAALAASGYNSTTGVITLASAYAGTTGVKTVNITPVTAANVYVLSPARSILSGSGNLSNP
jgi:hypothetical protein